MPASSAHTPPHTTHEPSVSPDPQSSTTSADQMARDGYTPNQQLNLPHHDRPTNGGLPRNAQRLMEPPIHSYGPPPVDFTHYTSAPLPALPRLSNGLPPIILPAPNTNNRKRPLSGSAERQTPTTNSSTTASIDPNLSSYARRAESQVDAMSTSGSGESREDRIDRVRRERDRLAEQVAAMNRQLLDMEEETG
jgi:hypothetical protein